MFLKTLTNTQLARLRYRVYERIERAFAGGLCYDIDLRTLAVCEPDWYTVWINLLNEFRARRCD